MTTQASTPIPQPDEASEPFFEGAAQGKLMLMRCTNCGAYRYPARDRCDQCWSTDTEWVQGSGRGTLFSWTLFHQVYHPGFADKIPYNVAVVELEEGPRIITNITGIANEELRANMPVEVVFEPVGDGVALPKFRPRA